MSSLRYPLCIKRFKKEKFIDYIVNIYKSEYKDNNYVNFIDYFKKIPDNLKPDYDIIDNIDEDQFKISSLSQNSYCKEYKNISDECTYCMQKSQHGIKKPFQEMDLISYLIREENISELLEYKEEALEKYFDSLYQKEVNGDIFYYRITWILCKLAIETFKGGQYSIEKLKNNIRLKYNNNQSLRETLVLITEKYKTGKCNKTQLNNFRKNTEKIVKPINKNIIEEQYKIIIDNDSKNEVEILETEKIPTYINTSKEILICNTNKGITVFLKKNNNLISAIIDTSTTHDYFKYFGGNIYVYNLYSIPWLCKLLVNEKKVNIIDIGLINVLKNSLNINLEQIIKSSTSEKPLVFKEIDISKYKNIIRKQKTTINEIKKNYLKNNNVVLTKNISKKRLREVFKEYSNYISAIAQLSCMNNNLVFIEPVKYIVTLDSNTKKRNKNIKDEFIYKVITLLLNEKIIMKKMFTVYPQGDTLIFVCEKDNSSKITDLIYYTYFTVYYSQYKSNLKKPELKIKSII
jgi:hypothetical protein